MPPAYDLQAGTDANRVENVLTTFSGPSQQKDVPFQWDSRLTPGPLHDTAIVAIKNDAMTGARKRRRKGKKKAPGPKGSTCLQWTKEVKRISALDHKLRTEVTRLRVFVTIRAPAEATLLEGKGFIQLRLGRLTQTFRRKGLRLIGILVYELKATDGARLHAHMLIYPTSRKALDLVANWADIYEPRRTGKRHDVVIHARPACAGDTDYLTKQRRPFSPDCEANTRHRRQPGAYIPGPRWTMTSGLKALNLETPAKTETPPVPVKRVEPVRDLAKLLGLLPDPSLLSRSDVAEQLGYQDRLHMANILRGPDGMSPTKRKYVEDLLETGEIR